MNLYISHAHLFHIPIPILFFKKIFLMRRWQPSTCNITVPIVSRARPIPFLVVPVWVWRVTPNIYIYISDHWGVVLIIQQSTSLHLCVSVSELSIHRLLPRVWCFVTQGYTNMKKICLSLQVNVF